MNNIYEQIARKREEMSKTQKKIADYILAHQVAASFHTVGRLAKETGVSEASVVRFANFLGFDGYTSFQKQMQEKTQNQMDTPQRLALSIVFMKEGKKALHRYLRTIFRICRIPFRDWTWICFLSIVHELIKAKRIFIVCSRSSSGLGLFFQYYLRWSGSQVYLIDDLQNNEELINGLCRDDFVFAISFKRYSKRTVDILSIYVEKKVQGGFIDGFFDIAPNPMLGLLSSGKGEYVDIS